MVSMLTDENKWEPEQENKGLGFGLIFNYKRKDEDGYLRFLNSFSPSISVFQKLLFFISWTVFDSTCFIC